MYKVQPATDARHNEPPRAACVGQWELFDSVDQSDHILARAICAECPMLLACDNLRRDVLSSTGAAMRKAGGGPQGTWAGVLIGGERPGQGSPKPREHGTDRGYHQHRWYGEPKCQPCKDAHAAKTAARASRRKVA